jgi:hypothetical protein
MWRYNECYYQDEKDYQEFLVDLNQNNEHKTDDDENEKVKKEYTKCNTK